MSVYKNTPPIVTNGLVIYYDPANSQSIISGSNLLTDISYTDKISGSLSAAAAYGTVSASLNSQYGGTFKFDGTSSYIGLDNSTPTTPIFPTASAKSMFAWINPINADTTGTSDTRVIYLSPNTTSDNFNVTLTSAYAPASANTYLFGGTPDNNGHYGYTTTAFPVNQWAYIGWTFDGINWLNYYNSVSYTGSSAIGSAFIFSQAGFFLGSRINGATSFFNGLMGPVQMYNRALSKAEVVQNYNAHKSRFNLT